jgi:hypothetical protein
MWSFFIIDRPGSPHFSHPPGGNRPFPYFNQSQRYTMCPRALKISFWLSTENGKEERTMKRFQVVMQLLGIIAILASLVFAGCAGPKPKPGEVFPCAADSQIDKEIAPEAEMTDFSCVVKPWNGSDTLHFTVGVKNVSNMPQRYKVNIFLDNGKAVGGLIPRKTNKGLVQPGETATFTYPVKGMDRGPDSVTILVKTMSQ